MDRLKEFIDSENAKKEKALINAVVKGDYTVLCNLLDCGVSIEVETLRSEYNSEGNSSTPLLIAAELGRDKCLKHLIIHGANLQAKDICGFTAVHLASKNGHVSCLRMLLEAGADYSASVDITVGPSEMPKGITALYLAARYNHVDCVKQLIQFGTNSDSVDIFGQTDCGVSIKVKTLRSEYNSEGNSSIPLLIAAELGHDKCLKHLIINGADLEAKDTCGFTAVHLASQNGHVSCLRMLLEAGADYSATVDISFCSSQTPIGTTALHLAARYNHVDCVKELIQFGSNCDSVDSFGQTSLCVAARFDYSACVLTHQSHTHNSSLSLPKHHTRDTPLHYAVKNGLSECVKRMIRMGSNVNYIDSNGFSALDLVCINHIRLKRNIRLEILRTIILEGDHADMTGALKKQIFVDSDMKVKSILVAYGADINIKEKLSGLTFLEYELRTHRNFDLIKCITGCMLQLPLLKSLEVYSLVSPPPEENSLSDFSLLPKYMDINLLRSERGMHVQIRCSDQLEDLLTSPQKVFPLQQPLLNDLYDYVCEGLKNTEHVSIARGQLRTSKRTSDIKVVLYVDRLLKVRQLLWYEKMASNPRSLMHCCRFSIRKSLGPLNIKHMNKLPLPESMISYLLFECDKIH